MNCCHAISPAALHQTYVNIFTQNKLLTVWFCKAVVVSHFGGPGDTEHKLIPKKFRQ